MLDENVALDLIRREELKFCVEFSHSVLRQQVEEIQTQKLVFEG